MSNRKINFRSLRFAIVGAIVMAVSLFSLIVLIGDSILNNNRTEENAKTTATDIGDQILMNYENYLSSMFNTFTYLEVELMNYSDMDIISNRFEVIKKSRNDIVNVILCDEEGNIKLHTGLSLYSMPKNTIKEFGSSSKYTFSSPYMIDGEYKILVGKMIMHSVGGAFEKGVLLVEYNFQSLVNISKSTNLGEGGALYILDSNYGIVYSMEDSPSPYLRSSQLDCIKDLIIGVDVLKTLWSFSLVCPCARNPPFTFRSASSFASTITEYLTA